MRKMFLVTALCLICLSPFVVFGSSDLLFEMDNPVAPKGWSTTTNAYNYGNNYLFAKCTGTTSATTEVVFDSGSPAYGTIQASPRARMRFTSGG